MPIWTANENALVLLNICVNIFCVNALWPSDYIWRQRPWLSFIHATICRPFDVINQLERIRSAFHNIHQRCKLYECIPRFWSELFVSPFTGDSYEIHMIFPCQMWRHSDRKSMYQSMYSYSLIITQNWIKYLYKLYIFFSHISLCILFMAMLSWTNVHIFGVYGYNYCYLNPRKRLFRQKIH